MSEANAKMKKRNQAGFTLAEVLVTLAIIATMAAVLLPALNSQLSKGDAGRVASDLVTIRTGSQAFLSDVHRYPGTITQLTTSVGTTDLLVQPIPTVLAGKWKGPYVNKGVVLNTSVGVISDAFTSVSTTNGINFLTISITGVALSDFQKIEDIIDEGVSAATASSTGQIRWLVASSGTLQYLALPIQ